MFKDVLIAACISTIVNPLVGDELIVGAPIPGGFENQEVPFEPPIAVEGTIVEAPKIEEIPVPVNVVQSEGRFFGKKGMHLGDVTIGDKAAIRAAEAGFLNLTINGNLVVGQEGGGRLEAEIDSKVGSSEIHVTGTTNLNGAEIYVTPTGSGIGLNTTYTLLTSEKIEGSIANVVVDKVNPALVRATLSSVDQKRLEMTFTPTFAQVAESPNEERVAAILEEIHATGAVAKEFLGALATLQTEKALKVFDELSGNQHTVDMFATSVLSRSFIRRLYDPIRDWVTTLPSESCQMSDYYGLDTWVEGSFDRQTLRNNGNGFGYNLSGGEITFGFQNHFASDWIFGIAGSYVAENIHFNLGGHSDLTGGFGGLYVLYRPDFFYALGDVAYGRFGSHMFRKACANTVALNAHSRPELSSWSFYAESGVDLPIYDILIQPFFGIEAFAFSRSDEMEKDADLFNLKIFKKDRGMAATRLGFHASTLQWISDFSFSLDVAWLYQLTTTRNDIRLALNEVEFITEGVPVSRNSLDGALTVQYFADETVEFYGQFGGQIWGNATSFSILGGLQLLW